MQHGNKKPLARNENSGLENIGLEKTKSRKNYEWIRKIIKNRIRSKISKKQ